MWRKEIHKLLQINEIVFESIENQSIFDLIFVPQNQIYFHLIDLKIFQDNSLQPDYFQALSDFYDTQNQSIIHLWEDIYFSHTELVESRILARLGKFNRLHARHCFIERIDKPLSDKFLKTNHLQGSVKAKFKYGLFLKPQYTQRFLGGIKHEEIENGVLASQPILIAVATFSGGRTMKVGERAGKRSFELIRFASLKGYVVVGGMNKLLKAFMLEHQPDDIMSYADRDWSDGRSYYKLDFTKIENSLPQNFNINLHTMERLVSCELSSGEFLKIFNAGSIKFINDLTKKSPVGLTEDFVY